MSTWRPTPSLVRACLLALARRLLQEDLAPELRTALTGTFPFAGADCEGMTERVLRALP